MNEAAAEVQNELVEARINIVRLLQGIAGDRAAAGESNTPEQELEMWRAKEALAEARVKLLEIGGIA